MKIYGYQGPTINFGDDLNFWLWPKLIPDLIDADPSVLLIGIGSVLFDNHDPSPVKVVFGAGFGGYRPPPVIDDSWFVYFVRGPHTARILKLDPSLGVGDPAALIQAVRPAPVAKRTRIAFMPHWESLEHGDWESVAKQAGIHLIDPRWPVETVLEHLMATESLVSEAMHGVIVADALRIPWIPIRPIMDINRAKWLDWADALGVTPRFVDLTASTWLESARRAVQSDRGRLRWITYHGKPYRKKLSGLWRGRAAESLRKAAEREPQLSADADNARALDKMLGFLGRLRSRDYLR